ncbi:MAG: DUF2769 domain-containing protein [Actinobacteria bacterium]|jgi:hypothetical protein|nr:DUF2769 domain-containing protein [Actinomycetota bacterium]
MDKVDYSEENAAKCWCSQCAVQASSDCARSLYQQAKDAQGLPPPERLPGLYCATGKASCTDLAVVNMCNCPACLVWAENHLQGNHYCHLGTA